MDFSYSEQNSVKCNILFNGPFKERNDIVNAIYFIQDFGD